MVDDDGGSGGQEEESRTTTGVAMRSQIPRYPSGVSSSIYSCSPAPTVPSASSSSSGDCVTVDNTIAAQSVAKSKDDHCLSNGILPVAEKSNDSSFSPPPSSSADKAINTVIDVIEVTKRRSRLLEKIIFMTSLSSVILMAYALVVLQWLLPYYYAVSAPLLIGLRVGLYIKYKWQYFLIDFCYFGNTMLYIFMWATPWLPEFFLILFGLTQGPLAWATVIFRNSLVFHNTDKMTSVYIHVLPLFVTYGIRWYPGRLSEHWYTSFVSTFREDVAYMFIWLIGVSFASFILHTLLYLIIVYGICRPDKSYLNSYRYLSSRNGWILTMLSVCGQKRRFLMYSLFNCFYCIISLLFTIVCYKYFIVNSIYLAFIILVVAWNGVVFYIDVFPVKGFGDGD